MQSELAFRPNASATPSQDASAPSDHPRIYVACLAAYNAGKAHGRWIDATQDVDAIAAEVAEMLAASPEPDAEEYAIHDFENFAGIELDECDSLATASALAALVVEHGELGAELYAREPNLSRALRLLTEAYRGEWSSLAEWAEDHLEQLGALAGLGAPFRCYFDFASFGADAEGSGDIFTVELGDGTVHVFDNHI